MATEEKKLPKATAEQAKQYDELKEQLSTLDPSWSDDEVNAICSKQNHLEDSYDWLHVEFTDPETGKVGVKDVAGNIVIPAQYDEVLTLGSYVYRNTFPHVVRKDGKVGIVKADGSGEALTDFRFDTAAWILGCNLFIAKWGGDKEHFGVVDPLGNVVCPNILTGFSPVDINQIIFIERHGKHGVIDGSTHLCVLPEYDEVVSSPDEFIVFRKGDQEGYVSEDGEFVTKEQYENDEHYNGLCYLHCMAD